MEPLDATPAPRLDIGRCFNEALDVYKKNVLALFLAAVLLELLSLFTLLVLAGPLAGGACLMTLKALRREDRAVELGDLFGVFGKFGPLVGLFFLTFFLSLLGLCLLIVPGLLLMTIWLFPFYLVVDRNMGVFDALRASMEIVTGGEFWKNFLLVLILFALGAVPALVPYVGIVVGWLLAPLAWLIVTSAYLQQVDRGRTGPDPLREAIQPAP